MLFRRLDVFVFSFFVTSLLYAQDPDFNIDPYTNWDGVTHWTRYLRISPGYTGPNALPVPEVNTGRLTEYAFKEISVDQHFHKEEYTANILTRSYFPVAGRIAIEFWGVAVEYYSMDTSLRYERRTFFLQGEGFAIGDVNFATTVQIFKDHEVLPDMALRVNLRTASGNGLQAVRFTDAPGYHIDLSFGKNVMNDKLRLYGMVGMYVWQTNLIKYPQNDAFLYGFGADVYFNKLTWRNNLGGYAGYIGNGDDPVVFRSSISTDRKRLNYKLTYQAGLQDFDYHTIKAAIILKFLKKKTKKV